MPIITFVALYLLTDLVISFIYIRNTGELDSMVTVRYLHRQKITRMAKYHVNHRTPAFMCDWNLLGLDLFNSK